MTTSPDKRLSNDRLLTILFVAFTAIVLFTRLVVFLRFNLTVIDTDQAYMWEGAVDYAHCFFAEPRYYGQDYNTYLEALVAVPLLYLKIPVYLAVPLATHFLALFPFLFTAFYLFVKRRKTAALLVLAVLMCLPITYDMLNALPRGFVTGLFFTSFFIISFLQPQKLTWIAINTVMAVIGYYVNPNSALVSGPFLFYIFLHNYADRRYYLFTLPALLCAWPLHLLFNQFYVDHPGYVLLKLDNTFRWSELLANLADLDARFIHVSFFMEKNSVFLLAAIVAIGVLLFKHNKKAFAAFVVFVLLLLTSLCFTKISDGSTWVFVSYSRMFLGIPLLLALLLALLPEPNSTSLVLLLIPAAFSIYKLTDLNPKMEAHGKNVSGPRLQSLIGSINLIDFYNTKCHENNCDFFLVSSRFWLSTILSCGGRAVREDFPATLETTYDKRYWVREHYKDKVVSSFLFLSSEYNLETMLPSTPDYTLVRLDNSGLYLVKNNTMKIGNFVKLVSLY